MGNTTSTNSEPPFRLLDLPPELRNWIYRETLVLKNAIDINAHNDDLHGKTSLLRTCKQIRSEAYLIFWSQNVFTFTTIPLKLQFADDWIDALTRDNARKIKRFVIQSLQQGTPKPAVRAQRFPLCSEVQSLVYQLRRTWAISSSRSATLRLIGSGRLDYMDSTSASFLAGIIGAYNKTTKQLGRQRDTSRRTKIFVQYHDGMGDMRFWKLRMGSNRDEDVEDAKPGCQDWIGYFDTEHGD